MTKSAILYRKVLPESICPSGIKALDLLKRQGYKVDDRHLISRADVDSFKSQNNVETTPQIFIDCERIGGFSDLQVLFGETSAGNQKTYRPVIAIFCVAALLAVAITWLVEGTILSARIIPSFISVAMVLLGLQKLQDIKKFADMFLSYDLLAQRWVRYGYIYPFIETGAGILMLAGALTWIAAPIALVASSIGTWSVFKAVYLDKRDLNCACVGGDSNVPLGFVSLLENLMMLGMSLWMLSKLI